MFVKIILKLDEWTKKELLCELNKFLSADRIKTFEASNRTRHFTVAVENVFQSHNASAVMRNCDCFGIQDIHVIANNNAYELSKDVAMGAEKYDSYYKKENDSQDCIDTIKSQGFQIVATTPHTNDVLLPEFDVTKKVLEQKEMVCRIL